MKKVVSIGILMLSIVLMSFQFFSTSIKITILNNLGKEEEGVRVRLYKTEEDYKTEKNKVDEHYTDRKGNVSFKNLEPIPYYINAVKENKTNAGNAELSDSLKKDMLNKMKIIISE